MKRTLIMLALGAMAVLLFAQTAWTVELAPSGAPAPTLPYQQQTLTPQQITGQFGSIPQDTTVSPDAAASPDATASPSATASVLPDTGGPSLGTPIAIAAALALLVSGLAVARVAWRSNAAS